jgi:hypothetical protein
MSVNPPPDGDPKSDAVLRDQVAAYDAISAQALRRPNANAQCVPQGRRFIRSGLDCGESVHKQCVPGRRLCRPMATDCQSSSLE